MSAILLAHAMRAVSAGTALLLVSCGGTPHGVPTRVIIPRGASFGEAADSLAKAKIIERKKLFRLYGRLTGGDRNIKPGTYLLKHGTPWSDIVSALNGGKGLVNTITIPEGYDLRQIEPRLARTLRVPLDSVRAATRDSALIARLNIPNTTLEGYLFPDTYAFPVGTTASQAVREMVRGFERRWKPEWDQRALDLNISRNDLVTMASLVEKEAILPEERPVIAAVYYNRLRKGMLLQADPTVQYALGKHVGRVLYKDLAVKSPYNTYLHPGLPPGPIASPGAASLAAAANPANVPYIYFVASPDGHHEFRMTLDEHNNAIRQVRRPLAADSPARKKVVAAKPAAKTVGKTAKRPAATRTRTASRTPTKSLTAGKTAARTTKKSPTRTAKSAKSGTKPAAKTTRKRTTTAAKTTTTTTPKKTTASTSQE